YVSLPSLCCDECAKTAGCKAYTYINANANGPVCYLKSAAGTPSRLVGAVSGKLN
ncbi:putative cbel-like protein, partial [Globisporangium polare]